MIAALLACLLCLPPQGEDPVPGLFLAIGHPLDLARTETSLLDGLRSGDASPETALLLLDVWLRLRPNGDAAQALLTRLAAAPVARDVTRLRLESHALRQRGELEAATAQLREAGRLDPADDMTLLVRALQAREDGRFDDPADGAIPLLRSLVALRPSCSTSLYLLADTLRIAGRAAEALPWIDGFSRAADPGTGLGLEERIWAGGLAADIEASDLRRPRAARERCLQLVQLAEGGSPESAERARILGDWYSRSADEAAAHAGNRRRLTRLALGATITWLALLAAVAALLRARDARLAESPLARERC